jgi:hypothetical protein
VETIRLLVTQFTDETITISSLVLLLVLCVLVAYWIYNRRKFQQLSHQIPASVVKNYLDSIIQNSTALKSSLFRGGGLDVGSGIPSVVPLSELPMGNISLAGAGSEELNQKIAEIALLKKQGAEKDRTITELERLLSEAKSRPTSDGDSSDNEEELTGLRNEVSKLKSALAQAKKDLASAATSSGGDDDAIQQELADVSKERDGLKERLMEYEIIEEDLANLKRLQQENEQLKKSLAALQGGGASPAPHPSDDHEMQEAVSEVMQEEDSTEVKEESAEVEEVAAAPSEEEESVAGSDGEEAKTEQKSAEELLSEFEKMLG